jgi:hypothetical protein
MRVGAEEANHPLGPLKPLDEPIEQDRIETAVAEADGIFVVLIKGVHHRLP